MRETLHLVEITWPSWRKLSRAWFGRIASRKLSKQKLRLVLDLRHVNGYLKKFTFRYKNLKTLAKMFGTGFYFSTFDLKNGYHHVSIHKDDVGCLGLSWEAQGKHRFFVFLVMPFGLAPASYVFTKMLRPLVKRCRGRGIRSIIYSLKYGSLWGG